LYCHAPLESPEVQVEINQSVSVYVDSQAIRFLDGSE